MVLFKVKSNKKIIHEINLESFSIIKCSLLIFKQEIEKMVTDDYYYKSVINFKMNEVETISNTLNSIQDEYEFSIKQLRTICEALYCFKNLNSNTSHLKEITEVFNFMQICAEIDFEKNLIKCKCKSNNIDVGEDATSLSNSSFYKK